MDQESESGKLRDKAASGQEAGKKQREPETGDRKQRSEEQLTMWRRAIACGEQKQLAASPITLERQVANTSRPGSRAINPPGPHSLAAPSLTECVYTIQCIQLSNGARVSGCPLYVRGPLMSKICFYGRCIYWHAVGAVCPLKLNQNGRGGAGTFVPSVRRSGFRCWACCSA